MLILGIETSCDETAIAILEKTDGRLSILSNVVSSQIALHAKWGGVVPNLAAREHLKNIIPVLKSALKEADKKMEDIDLISVTQGPGLIPALLIGTNFAKTLSYIYQKPLLGIHHIEGHIYANLIGEKSEIRNPKSEKIKKSKISSKNIPAKKLIDLQTNYANPKFPILALVVSGGHTQLILMEDHFKYQIIGETLDDAVGEAFDKVARILGLGYPGGPIISQKANEHKNKSTKQEFKKPIFPRPMLHSHDFNFSFSGLKTSVLYYVKKYRKENELDDNAELPEEFIQEVAYEFQEAAVDILIFKTIGVALKYNPQTVFIAGGVSANNNLREKMATALEEKTPNINYHLQPREYSTDNAAMIAAAATYRWEKMTHQEKNETLENWKTLTANAQLKI